MLSCKRLKRTHIYKVLAKELETIHWVFGIEMAPTYLRHLMFNERRLKLLKKKALMKRDQVVPVVMLIKT